MTAPLKFSPARVAEILACKRAGMSWTYLAASLGCSVDGLRRNVDSEYRLKLNARIADYARRNYVGVHATIDRRGRDVVVVRAPDYVLAERDARANTRRSLTAVICGDPPPGFSALDRMPRQ